MFIGLNYKINLLSTDLANISLKMPKNLRIEIKQTTKLLAFYNKYRKHLYKLMIRQKYIKR